MYTWIIFIKNLTPSNFQISQINSESILLTPLSQNGVWKDGMIDLDLGSTETNTDSEKWLKTSKGSRSRLIQEVGPNQEVKTQVYIHFPTTECDFLRLVIQVQGWQV